MAVLELSPQERAISERKRKRPAYGGDEHSDARFVAALPTGPLLQGGELVGGASKTKARNESMAGPSLDP